MFQIATWNVNSLRIRLSRVLEWLESTRPDILALQETKLTDDSFPRDEFCTAGYQAIYSGQKTYNGVATLSKTSASNIIKDLPGYADPQRRVLCANFNGLAVLNLYVPNGAEIGSDKYTYKLEWFSHLHTYIQELLKNNRRVIILGDFNIAPEDQDVHDPLEWQGKVLVSEPERAEFRRLLSHGLKDSFRLFEQAADSYSWWDYRAASFQRNRGLRIDHILVNTALAENCVGCRIDKSPRSLERPSDHVPVIAEFNL